MRDLKVFERLGGSKSRIFHLPDVVTVVSELGLLEDGLIFPLVGNAVPETSRVFGVAHHILLGHSTCRSDVCNTWWQIVENLLDLADPGDSLAATGLVRSADGVGWAGLASILEEHEGCSLVV